MSETENKLKAFIPLFALFYVLFFSALLGAQVPVPGNNGVNPLPPIEDPNAGLPAQPTATQATIQATPQSAESPIVPGASSAPDNSSVSTGSSTNASPQTIAPSPVTEQLSESTAVENISTESERLSTSGLSALPLSAGGVASADQTPVAAVAVGPKPWPLPPKQMRLLYPELAWPKVNRESDTVYSTKNSFESDTAEQVREKLGNYCANTVEQYQTDAKDILKIDDLTNYFGQICNFMDQYIAIRGITYTDLDIHRQTLNAQLDSAFFSAYHLPFRELLSQLADQQQPPVRHSLLSSLGVPSSMESVVEQFVLFLALIISLLSFFKDSFKNSLLKKITKKNDSTT